MTEYRYEIVVTVPAARAIREMLPEAVAFAVIDFITGPLLDNPRLADTDTCAIASGARAPVETLQGLVSHPRWGPRATVRRRDRSEADSGHQDAAS